MSLGSVSAARTPRTTRPNMGAGAAAGGGGGGGAAPTAPSDVATATPANYLFGWGSLIHRNVDSSAYTTHAGWGFLGARSNIGYLSGYGGNQLFKGSTASGDSGTSGSYILQRSYEGLATTDAINGNSNRTGLGLFKSGKTPGILQKAYLGCYVTAQTHPATGLFGDIGNSTVRADVATKMGGLAGFVNFIGGDGVAFDLETGTWDSATGYTTAQNLTNLEQLGYEIGTAIWTVNPALELIVYNLQPNNSWHEVVTSGLTGGVVTSSGRANSALSRVQFMFGIFRAYAALSGTGRIRWIDHYWYRGLSNVSGVSLITALKWNTQGSLAGLSRDLPAASWNAIAQKFDITPFSWAGTDNGAFYNSTQEAQPTWTNNQETYRQYGMGGWRCEYTQDQGFPGGNAQYGLYAGSNNYSFPSGRTAAMSAVAANTSGSYSTSAPTLSASSSGSGSTRALSGTAAHAFGVRCVKVYIYPSGTPVYAQMTWNLGGGSATSGITNSYMDWTANLTGVNTGDYAIVTAYSTQNQEHSTVVAL